MKTLMGLSKRIIEPLVIGYHSGMESLFIKYPHLKQLLKDSKNLDRTLDNTIIEEIEMETIPHKKLDAALDNTIIEEIEPQLPKKSASRSRPKSSPYLVRSSSRSSPRFSSPKHYAHQFTDEELENPNLPPWPEVE